MTKEKEKMQKCLGIYIESNLIKYAKVSKERNDFKVEAFGLRFYEDLGSEIKKIIEETFSFNVPISINLQNEKYLYFDVFALLSKKDIEKTVVTEFESFCNEKQYNTNAFEMRYALAQNNEDKEKIKAIDIYANKIQLNRQIEMLDGFKLDRVAPMPMTIGNIANLNKAENQIIVNMEEETSITTIVNQQIDNVEILEFGSRDVLDNINKIENSYAKAYELCKNTTIYTAEMEESGDEQPYLQYIIPVIYKIAQKLLDMTTQGTTKFQTIYLTGTLAAVNNIDLYFQEFLPNVECKLLKPKFLEDAVTKLNVKEYMEVNSAISLAVNQLGEGIQELNFRRVSTKEKLSKVLNIEINKKNGGKFNVKESFKTKLDGSEIWFIRVSVILFMIFLIFCICSKLLSNSMLKKEDEIKELQSKEDTQIASINSNATSINSKTQKYQALISDLEEIDKKTNDIAASRNLIPNLLNQLMFVIPEKVQLVSIENTTGKTMSIKAQSDNYDQLGYFIATLKTNKILKNVVSSSGIKESGTINVTIEGDLP